MLVLRGVGIGFSFMPAMTAAFAALRPEQLSDATPQLNVLQRIGGAIGTAVLAVVLQRASGATPTRRRSLAHAFDTAYWWSLGIVAAVADPLPGAAACREPARAASARRPAQAPRRPSSRSGSRSARWRHPTARSADGQVEPGSRARAPRS